jgi:ribonuclease J
MGREQERVTIYPIGGLGEIGINCLYLETETTGVLIDCGLMFPDTFHYGVDVVIPRLDFIISKKDKLKGIILTHGHEDHIGALPWLMKDIDVPIYGSTFTLALVENKIRDYNLSDLRKLCLKEVGPRDSLELGDLKFHFFPVCHSIIQGYALGIETPVGKIVHTGDFKIDRNPLGGHKTDLEGIYDFSKDGVTLLLSDSTNIELEGFALTEKEVMASLEKIFNTARGRILITLFSSHIQRIQEIFELTKSLNRKMAISGKSLVSNVEIAKKLGVLKLDENYLCPLEDLNTLKDEEIVLLVTGSQGEPMSALTRLAEESHRQLKIHPGDTVIMSSRFIPGNTKAITSVINKLYKLGAEVLYEKVQDVHASGHAHKEELRLMLNTVKPKFFIPIHGEYRHLVKHKKLAIECGVAPERALVIEDGNPVTFFKDGIRFEEEFQANVILVDGKGVGDVGTAILKERQLLADEGLVILIMVLENETGEILIGPRLQSKGFIFEQEYSYILEKAEQIVLDIYHRSGKISKSNLKKKVKNSLRRYFRRTLERDPVVIPVIIGV